MNITIRRAKLEDSTRILELLEYISKLHCDGRPDIFKTESKKYGEEDLIAIFSDEARPVFVAVDESEMVVGYCFCMIMGYEMHNVFKDHTTLYIDDFCIDESYKANGIGKKLFNEVKEFAKELGVYNIDLNVWSFNESAIKFYETCGLKPQKIRMELVL